MSSLVTMMKSCASLQGKHVFPSNKSHSSHQTWCLLTKQILSTTSRHPWVDSWALSALKVVNLETSHAVSKKDFHRYINVYIEQLNDWNIFDLKKYFSTFLSSSCQVDGKYLEANSQSLQKLAIICHFWSIPPFLSATLTSSSRQNKRNEYETVLVDHLNLQPKIDITTRVCTMEEDSSCL